MIARSNPRLQGPLVSVPPFVAPRGLLLCGHGTLTSNSISRSSFVCSVGSSRPLKALDRISNGRCDSGWFCPRRSLLRQDVANVASPIALVDTIRGLLQADRCVSHIVPHSHEPHSGAAMLSQGRLGTHPAGGQLSRRRFWVMPRHFPLPHTDQFESESPDPFDHPVQCRLVRERSPARWSTLPWLRHRDHRTPPRRPGQPHP